MNRSLSKDAGLRLLQIEEAALHPAFLLHHVKCVDSRSGDVFEFEMLTPQECERIVASSRRVLEQETWVDLPNKDYLEQKERLLEVSRDWSWQRPYLEWILDNDQTITLKGRQLGVTWVWAGLALHYLLFRPGSDVLIYSIKEDDAVEVVNRIWDMYTSLPDHFKNMVRVLKPTRGAHPSTRIEVEHPDGRVSTITGMPGTKSAGHSRSAALVIFDEASRQDYARELWKAVIPATGDKGGKIGVVSTANGMSDGKGMGNFFHEVWIGSGEADYPKVAALFLGWWLHPERTQYWYDHLPLDQTSKAEQYPNTPQEAFLLSGSPYFDVTALRWYAENLPKVLYKAEWHVDPRQPNKARLFKGSGPITIIQEPDPKRKYAVAADVATGVGTDYSVGAVIDLHDMAPVAELYMKADYKEFTTQLHYLGLWYSKARLAPETGGGYGDTVIAYLRDGLDGRKPYPFLYRHRPYDRTDRPQSKKLGFPMTMKTRPKVVSELRRAVNEKQLPWVTQGFLNEAFTFVNRETRPSPRAADGCNDDRVMAWGIALEMFSEFGEHEHDRKKSTRKSIQPAPQPTPWTYH